MKNEEYITGYKEGINRRNEQLKAYFLNKHREVYGVGILQSVQANLIEEIYIDLFNERIPNSNPYIK